MIHRLIKIDSCGRFYHFIPSEKEYGWNGVFEKINTIYAENGSGKTTLTQILKSASKNDCDLMDKRKSLQSKDPVYVDFLMNNNNRTFFSLGKWNNIIPHIEVFDSFYSETNMYVLSLGNYDNPSDFYDIVPDSGKKILEIRKMMGKRKNLSNNIRITRKNIRDEKDFEKKESFRKKLEIQQKKKKELNEVISLSINNLNELVKSVGRKYFVQVNNYLQRFNPNLEILDPNQQGQQLVYYIKLNGQEVRSDNINLPLRHVLSEGDKSSLALSFFLARIDLLKDIEKRIIVFDDPISSFDTRRRMTTVSILSKYAEKAQQFFLLSHDLYFIKDFNERNKKCLNLKIIWKDSSSVIIKHNVKAETLTGVFKDIHTLQKYQRDGAMDDIERREVIRCLRPVLEGVFRFKYFHIIKDDEWLGDFLSKIRQCDDKSPLYRLKELYDDLSDINDYCKQYHHSNPNNFETPIYDEELRQFVDRTLQVLMYI